MSNIMRNDPHGSTIRLGPTLRAQVDLWRRANRVGDRELPLAHAIAMLCERGLRADAQDHR